MDVILTFHSIDASGSVVSYAPDEFRRLVEGLLEEGVRFVGIDEILRPPTDGRHRALLTFDDGFESVHEQALPVLSRLAVPALLYVVTDWVGRDNRWPTQGGGLPTLRLMSWDALRELASAGFELGSHTANHVHLPELSDDECARELSDSRRRLQDELQRDVQHFAYPYGSHGAASVALVARHYATAATTKMRLLESRDDPHLLPRIDAYYLRDPERRLPLFGSRTRRYLRFRAALRGIRTAVQG